MNKRGQLTIFIILAILIVAGVALFFVFRDDLGNKSSGEVNSDPLQIYVQECIDDLIITGIQLIGIQGGYYYMPEEFLLTEYADIAYGYNNRKVLISKSELEKQINYYIEDVVYTCVNNEVILSSLVDVGQPKATTSLQGEKILVKLNFPITLEKGDSKSVIRNFKSEININLEDFLSVSNDIINEASTNDGYLDLSYLTDLGYTVTIIPYRENFIYSLENEAIKLNEEEFIFNFVYKK
jgi:hypothetical protein